MKKAHSKEKPASGNCLNCGTPLDTAFCPNCGQKNRDYRLSFRDLFSDFVEELLDVDSRVLKSLRLLFTRPGFLTREYIRGRRVSYLPPVRLYLIASVLFFLTLSIKTLLPTVRNSTLLKEWSETGDLDEALKHTANDMLEKLPQAEQTTGQDSTVAESVAADSSHGAVSVMLADKTYDVQQSDFMSTFSDNFAKMMFLLLPVAALLLKMLYWRRKKLYIEHLIFSLHVHAFIFSLLILTVILDYRVVTWGVLLWSHVYLYLAMKNYYAQGYVKTFFKMALLLFSYGITLIVAMTLTLVGTAVSLQLSDKL